MDIRYQPDALYHAYKTVRLEDKLGEDMTDQKRRIEDKLPGHSLDWEDPDVKAAKEGARLANAFAAAGSAFLEHTNTASALAAIPNTAPQQYVVAGTLPMIAKVLPADSAAHLAGQSQATKVQAVPEVVQHALDIALDLAMHNAANVREMYASYKQHQDKIVDADSDVATIKRAIDALNHTAQEVTQQAAKAETAEKAEGEQTNVPPPFAAPASQQNAGVAHGDIVAAYTRWMHDSSRFPHADDTRHPFEAFSAGVNAACRFRAQGGNTTADISDLAPTTSTVSAPDEIRNAAIVEVAEHFDPSATQVITERDAYRRILALRTVSTAGAQNAEAIRNALQPFADLAELFDDGRRGGTMPDSGPVMTWPRVNKEYVLTVEHLRAARDALQSGTASTKEGGVDE